MQFGSVPIAEAEGAILAHSRRLNGRLLRKGYVLGAADIDALSAAGVREIVVARLEGDDIAENDAAHRIATLCTGAGAVAHAPFTGRVNLFAATRGLAVIDAGRVDALNAIDESITVATLAPFAPVEERQMLATIKIIPFAVPKAALEAAEKILAAGPVVSVKPFLPHEAALISTVLPDTSPSALAKNRTATDARLQALNSRVALERRTPHETAPLRDAIAEAAAAGHDPILIFGASASTDRRDIVPAAIVAAGGRIEYFGMPVDPGNLLFLGRVGNARIVGLPGCARSPKQNGIDFVLRRMAAGLVVAPRDIAAMGVGGLLMEIGNRPQPREEPPRETPRAPRVAAIILAAGKSSRMGNNKLLAPLNGAPLVRHVVEAAHASTAAKTIAVTGKDADAVREALNGLPVTFVHNDDYSNGLSTSLKCGIKSVPDDFDGAVIVLGDMPSITADHLNALIAGFRPADGRAICVATHQGKRGNPVLWARRFFQEIIGLEGDVGAKHIIATNDDLVYEIEFATDAPLVDIDTPDDLHTYLAQHPSDPRP
jgi:molybdenum cofactor cytidylyltransferase